MWWKTVLQQAPRAATSVVGAATSPGTAPGADHQLVSALLLWVLTMTIPPAHPSGGRMRTLGWVLRWKKLNIVPCSDEPGWNWLYAKRRSCQCSFEEFKTTKLCIFHNICSCSMEFVIKVTVRLLYILSDLFLKEFKIQIKKGREEMICWKDHVMCFWTRSTNPDPIWTILSRGCWIVHALNTFMVTTYLW